MTESVRAVDRRKKKLVRALKELRRRHSEAAVARALDALRIETEGDTAIVSRSRGAPFFGVRQEAGCVRIEPGVLAQTPSSRARVRVLARAAAIAPRVEIHAPITTDGTYLGRLVIDLPRRIARALHLPAAEPGDRFSGEGDDDFLHAFFDDEPLLLDAARAGLRFVARRGSWLVLERPSTPELESKIEPRSPSVALEIVRVLRVVLEAERRRLGDSPERAVEAMRSHGRGACARGPIARARLRRTIGWIDAMFPGEPNCFRRTLVEVALDARAAEETLVFGLDVGRTGHVAFLGAESLTFDVFFEVPARTKPDRPQP